MDLELRGQVALVTGSNRGTGSAIALALAREGAQVLVHGPAADAGQQAVCDAITKAGGQASPVSGDLETDAGADQVHAQAERAGAPVSVLVNNYGGASQERWSSTGTHAWHASYDKNVLSAVRMVQRFVPAMREAGHGRVILVATIGVIRPNARMPDYYAAKAALATMGASLCKELTGTGITVNTVSPGLIHTAEVEAGFRATAKKRGWGDDWPEIERRAVAAFMPNPCQRMARREEVADLVTFLASARASYLNGAHIPIDGGALA